MDTTEIKDVKRVFDKEHRKRRGKRRGKHPAPSPVATYVCSGGVPLAIRMTSSREENAVSDGLSDGFLDRT